MAKIFSGEIEFPAGATLGQRIAQARRRFGLAEARDVTVPEAAALVGVSTPTWWRWERDERKPNRPTLTAIAHALGCSVEDLIPSAGPGASAEATPTAWGAELPPRVQTPPLEAFERVTREDVPALEAERAAAAAKKHTAHPRRASGGKGRR